jgi:hypothetical protein
METPDSITIEGGHHLDWHMKGSYPVTILIINGMVLYSMNNHMTHSTIFQTIVNTTRKNKEDVDTTISDLNASDVGILNLDRSVFAQDESAMKDLYERYAQRYTDTKQAPKNICSGRFWKVNDGYISFWDEQKKVMNFIGYVEQLIKKLGFDPKTVKWEVQTRNGSHKLVSHAEYTIYQKKSKETKTDEEARAQQYALHTKAGMKRLVGVQGPPRATRDVEYKQMRQEAVKSDLQYSHPKSLRAPTNQNAV